MVARSPVKSLMFPVGNQECNRDRAGVVFVTSHFVHNNPLKVLFFFQICFFSHDSRPGADVTLSYFYRH